MNREEKLHTIASKMSQNLFYIGKTERFDTSRPFTWQDFKPVIYMYGENAPVITHETNKITNEVSSQTLESGRQYIDHCVNLQDTLEVVLHCSNINNCGNRIYKTLKQLAQERAILCINTVFERYVGVVIESIDAPVEAPFKGRSDISISVKQIQFLQRENKFNDLKLKIQELEKEEISDEQNLLLSYGVKPTNPNNLTDFVLPTEELNFYPSFSKQNGLQLLEPEIEDEDEKSFWTSFLDGLKKIKNFIDKYGNMFSEILSQVTAYIDFALMFVQQGIILINNIAIGVDRFVCELENQTTAFKMQLDFYNGWLFGIEDEDGNICADGCPLKKGQNNIRGLHIKVGNENLEAYGVYVVSQESSGNLVYEFQGLGGDYDGVYFQMSSSSTTQLTNENGKFLYLESTSEEIDGVVSEVYRWYVGDSLRDTFDYYARSGVLSGLNLFEGTSNWTRLSDSKVLKVKINPKRKNTSYARTIDFSPLAFVQNVKLENSPCNIFVFTNEASLKLFEDVYYGTEEPELSWDFDSLDYTVEEL